MNLDLSQYQTLVFDCDGVVLNSNKVKTQAFYDATLSFGQDKAKALVDYHVRNGGISRYLKFEYFIQEILKQDVTQSLLDGLLSKFATEVKIGLMQSEIAPGLVELRKQTSQANWLIVSGGDQDELREVFAARELFDLFDGGIFGSPDDKDVILKRELQTQTIHAPALFLGDSKYDFQASNRAGLDFVFLTDWSEVKDWSTFQNEHGFPVANNVASLLQN
ncbi:haloacid dehalogenase [Thiomicrorhabdus immobilis]|uniref:phosphoglycolate phosphatase n=1 Tax=Thiomicrorhabdus immobilis TaxID=2791037 RepID=A0ABN6D1D6_9GAMM|nr:HAD-IA family hydrolase [Thiomicrorhabdus immobilis]BCN93942.1 haloacid dehalogenase [Thiomicrorhabdus immobilis]